MNKIITLMIVVVVCLIWLELRRDHSTVGPEEGTAAGNSGARELVSKSAPSDRTEHPKGWAPNGRRENMDNMAYAPRIDEILRGTDPVQRPIEFCTLFGQWLEEDFEGALSYLREIPRGNEYTEGVRMALERLENHDPARAVALMGELVTRHEEMHLYNHVFARLAAESPSTAVRFVEQAPEGEPRSNAIRAVASVWTTTDAEFALNWAANLLMESERETAVESVLLIREPQRTRATENTD